MILRKRVLGLGVLLLVTIGLLAACKEKPIAPVDTTSCNTEKDLLVGEPPICPERLIATYITPKHLVAKEVRYDADTMVIVVGVFEEKRIENSEPYQAEFLRISRDKGDIDYYDTIHVWAWAGSLAPDVRGISVFECQPDGAGKKDIGASTRVVHESLDAHIYNGYMNPDVYDSYELEARVQRIEQPLKEFEGIRLPNLADYWTHLDHPLFTLRISPPPAVPGLVRIEVLLDKTSYTLDVETGRSFHEEWVRNPDK